MFVKSDGSAYSRSPRARIPLTLGSADARWRTLDGRRSFEGTGQKIREPREVLVDRWGTCLDLATTYAWSARSIRIWTCSLGVAAVTSPTASVGECRTC